MLSDCAFGKSHPRILRNETPQSPPATSLQRSCSFRDQEFMRVLYYSSWSWANVLYTPSEAVRMSSAHRRRTSVDVEKHSDRCPCGLPRVHVLPPMTYLLGYAWCLEEPALALDTSSCSQSSLSLTSSGNDGRFNVLTGF